MDSSRPGCNTSGDYYTGNVTPILNEVRHALAQLIESGEPTTIDLRAIPLGPGEEGRIEERLGVGEVDIHIDALGPSRIRETALSGVWLVVHYNADEEILGKFIEITRIPEIAMSPRDDMRECLETLSASLQNQASTWRQT